MTLIEEDASLHLFLDARDIQVEPTCEGTLCDAY